ncbi:3824_t:CDS:10 [Paraglomus occultum]|uniref:Stress response protein NST1 n=1 Tax=Paraglomus occultum TaxID=144539 RepID=A0A9N9FH68_9GLOM|nr:3824_t:CDS:10 [Paraglomus occultum]
MASSHTFQPDDSLPHPPTTLQQQQLATKQAVIYNKSDNDHSLTHPQQTEKHNNTVLSADDHEELEEDCEEFSDDDGYDPEAPGIPFPRRDSATAINDGIWNTNNREERQRIREFWLQLGEEERRSLLKVEKEAVLSKYEDDEEDDEEECDEEEEEYDGSSHGSETRREIFGFANSLTAKGGILTVADDLLMNDGKKFLEMMERLAEHRPVLSIEVATEQQRMEQSKKMFQVFAAEMFGQRVLAAYKEKVAQERQKKFLEELEEENRLKEEPMKMQKIEERQRKEQERAAEEAAQRAERERKAEEERKRREEERQRKEAERRAREEERLRKEEEKRRKAREEKEREERRRKEQEAKERKEREEREQKEQREARMRKEIEEREKREQEERERKEREERQRAVSLPLTRTLPQQTSLQPQQLDRKQRPIPPPIGQSSITPTSAQQNITSKPNMPNGGIPGCPTSPQSPYGPQPTPGLNGHIPLSGELINEGYTNNKKVVSPNLQQTNTISGINPNPSLFASGLPPMGLGVHPHQHGPPVMHSHHQQLRQPMPNPRGYNPIVPNPHIPIPQSNVASSNLALLNEPVVIPSATGIPSAVPPVASNPSATYAPIPFGAQNPLTTQTFDLGTQVRPQQNLASPGVMSNVIPNPLPIGSRRLSTPHDDTHLIQPSVSSKAIHRPAPIQRPRKGSSGSIGTQVERTISPPPGFGGVVGPSALRSDEEPVAPLSRRQSAVTSSPPQSYFSNSLFESDWRLVKVSGISTDQLKRTIT